MFRVASNRTFCIFLAASLGLMTSVAFAQDQSKSDPPSAQQGQPNAIQAQQNQPPQTIQAQTTQAQTTQLRQRKTRKLPTHPAKRELPLPRQSLPARLIP